MSPSRPLKKFPLPLGEGWGEGLTGRPKKFLSFFVAIPSRPLPKEVGVFLLRVHQPISAFEFAPIRTRKMTGEFASTIVSHVLLRFMSSAR